MISITRLLYDLPSYGDELRYRPDLAPADERRPIVVWNTTRRCNLRCIHCYSDSSDIEYKGELTTDEAKKMLSGLADFGVPVILFSGGEPLLRRDLFELNNFAKRKNLRTVISTNGTLISKEIARRIKDEGFDYVGISLDGMKEINDRFRGKSNAFNLALCGIRNLVEVRQKVGLRFTITRHNYLDLPDIFKLAEVEGINRICFYHLVYSGRGSSMSKDDLDHSQMRQCIDSICEWALLLHKKNKNLEVLTVDNHADGPYIYLRLKERDPQRAKKVLKLLRYNRGNNSGIGIANIDNLGFVHADQFWQDYSFGNVRERKFGDIWQDISNPVMQRLKERKLYLKGRCARCGFLDICNGNLRIRAKAIYKDIWQQDPACYLTEEEIKCNIPSSVPED